MLTNSFNNLKTDKSTEKKHSNKSEAVFLVDMGTSSFPAMHAV
jgi:hypothetical protein